LGKKSIMVSLYIDQNEKVEGLIKKVKSLPGIPLVDKKNAQG